MKHLLIGGAGFLGRNLAQELLSRGDEVTVYDNYSFSSPLEIEHPNLQVMLGDATNETSLSSALMSFKPDNVVWLAYFFAYDPNNVPHVRHSWLMHGLVKILPAIANLHTSRFIYISSDSVYKPKTTLLKETSLVNWGSSNLFVSNKIIAEAYVTSLCKHLKVPWIILRPSIIVGKREHLHPMADPLTFIIHAMLTEQPLLVKHGQQKRDYILVEQASKMIANVLHEKKSSGVYNVSSAVGTTNSELIQLLIPLIHPQVLPKVIDSKEGNFVLDNAKIMALCQDKRQVELVDMLTELSGIVEHRKARLEENVT
jgi:nucleoside-diphosphate-sugar epimerase